MQQRRSSVHARLGVYDLIEAGNSKPGRIAALTSVHIVTEGEDYFQQLLQLPTSYQISRRFQHSYTATTRHAVVYRVGQKHPRGFLSMSSLIVGRF